MSFQDYQGIIGIIGGMIGLAVAVATYFRGVIQQNAKIHTLELDLNTVKTQFNVFWAVIEKELPKVLIKETTPHIDVLLRKMQTKQGLTEDEKITLKNMMQYELDSGIGEVDSGRALGYALLIARIVSTAQTPELVKSSSNDSISKRQFAENSGNSSDRDNKGVNS